MRPKTYKNPHPETIPDGVSDTEVESIRHCDFEAGADELERSLREAGMDVLLNALEESGG